MLSFFQLFAVISTAVVSVLVCVVTFVRSFRMSKKPQLLKNGPLSFGLFHPYCNDGGGGERVLWCLIQALQKKYPNSLISVYSGVEYTSDGPNRKQMEGVDILKKATNRFNIKFPNPDAIQFFFLSKRSYVESSRYPRFTLILQSLGAIPLVYEALCLHQPDVFIDSMGYAFTFPVVKLLTGSKVVAYIHYPTISTDMLDSVREERPNTIHNSNSSSGSILKKYAKIVYYQLFALLYGFVGLFSDLVLCNSTWTYGHVKSLFYGDRSRIHVVFPPCDTKSLQALPLENRENLIVSVGQFRPEKDHMLQLQSFKMFLDLHSTQIPDVKIALIGSCRHNNKEDELRLSELKRFCVESGISSQVEFHVGIPHKDLASLFGRAKCGIHTMWNEHFGIGVVEFMAAGLVTIAHDSGGPKSDILLPHRNQTVGFLAATKEQYCDVIHRALTMDEEKRRSICETARDAADKKFSDEEFYKVVIDKLSSIISN